MRHREAIVKLPAAPLTPVTRRPVRWVRSPWPAVKAVPVPCRLLMRCPKTQFLHSTRVQPRRLGSWRCGSAGTGRNTASADGSPDDRGETARVSAGLAAAGGSQERGPACQSQHVLRMWQPVLKPSQVLCCAKLSSGRRSWICCLSLFRKSQHQHDICGKPHGSYAGKGSMTEAPQSGLVHRVRYLRLPSIVKEFGKLAH